MFRRFFILLVLTLFIFALAFFTSGESIQGFQNQTIRKPDYLFTFGIEPKRYSHSRSLAESFPEATWLISDPINYVGKRLEKDTTWSQNHIAIHDSHSTFAEVLWLAVFLKKQPKYKMFLLISSKWHCERIKNICQKIFDENEMERIQIHAIPDTLFNYPKDMYSHWYKYSNMRLEALKTLFYHIRY